MGMLKVGVRHSYCSSLGYIGSYVRMSAKINMSICVGDPSWVGNMSAMNYRYQYRHGTADVNGVIRTLADLSLIEAGVRMTSIIGMGGNAKGRAGKVDNRRWCCDL